jgi:hypothetical protein
VPTIDQFFSLPANNKYGTKYTISEASDMTPENVNDRDPLDTWLQDDDVSSVMDEYFDALDLDKKWAVRFPRASLEWFGNIPAPSVATEKYGYPSHQFNN